MHFYVYIYISIHVHIYIDGLYRLYHSFRVKLVIIYFVFAQQVAVETAPAAWDLFAQGFLHFQ